MSTEATGSVPQYVFKTVGERKLVADVLYPEGWSRKDRRAAIVFWSGGAFRSGGTQQFSRQAQYFAERGMVAIRAEYRGRETDNIEVQECLKDAISAMRWVRKNAAMLGADENRIVGAGGSAGGYLATAVWTTEDLHSPDDDLAVSPRPNAMVLFNPALGFSRQITLLPGGGREEKPSVGVPEPLDGMKQGMPPALIMIGSADKFLAACEEFVAKGRKLGNRVELEVYEGQPHAFFNRSPWMEKTVLRADEFLRSIGYLDEEPKVEPPTTE